MKINRLWMLVAASMLCVPSSFAQYGEAQTTQQSTHKATIRNVTTYRAPGSPMMLRGGVSKSPMRAFGPGNAQFMERSTLSQTKIGPVMEDPAGNTSTMLPADLVPLTGYVGPADGGASYSPGYANAVKNYLGRIQLMGPMSVVYSGPSLLRPQSMLVHDVLVNGCPGRASGAVIMEAPGYFDRSGNLIARRQTVHEYVASKKAVSKRKGVSM